MDKSCNFITMKIGLQLKGCVVSAPIILYIVLPALRNINNKTK